MKNLTLVVLLFMTSGLCLGQVPTPAIRNATTELYVGYLTTFPGYGPHYNSYQTAGGEVAIARFINPHLAVVASVDGVFGSVYQVKQYATDIGVKYNLLTDRFRPFVQARVGFAYQASNGMYASSHHPPLTPGTNDVESGFAYRIGAGVEFQMTKKVYWRMLQADLEPEPWGPPTQYYYSFGSGLGYHF